jgi:Ca2+-binding RTX toxin-like protein
MSEPCRLARLLDRSQVFIAIVLGAASSVGSAQAGNDSSEQLAAAQRRAPAFCADGGPQLWANLAQCGWPGPTNTGAPAGTRLRNTNGRTITTDNAVIDGERIDGQIIVRADNVTIKNSSISWDGGGAGGSGVIKIEGGYSATISHVEINGLNHTHSCIWHEGARMTANAVNCHGVNDGIFSWAWEGGRDPASGDNFTITNSYFHNFTDNAANGHIDGWQTNGAGHGIIWHNTYDMPMDATSAIAIWNDHGDSGDILVGKNLMTGAGFTLYAEDKNGTGGVAEENVPGSAVGGFSVRDIRFVDNRFSTSSYPHTGASSRCVGVWGVWFYRGGWPSYYGGPTDLWNSNGSLRSGNVVLETGENIDRGGPSGCEGANTSPLPATCQGRPITEWLPPLKGWIGQDVIRGTSGNDEIHANASDDFVCAGGGDNSIYGGFGNDQILGEAGDDTIYGGKGKDVMGGGTGAGDVCDGGPGIDAFFGGSRAASGCETVISIP